MAAGEVVFDGPVGELTRDVVHMIYGADGTELSEEITSISLGGAAFKDTTTVGQLATTS